MFQNIKTLSKTVIQTIKFRKKKKSVVLVTFLKDQNLMKVNQD